MTIKGILLEIASRKRGALSVSPQDVERAKRKISKVWNSNLPEALPPKLAAGVDGSRNKKVYAGYVVYALGVASLVFEKERRKDSVINGDVDILKPEEYSDSRLRNLMGILEYKGALSTLPKTELLFLDGSIVGALVRPNVFLYEVKGEVKKFVEELFEELKGKFSSDKIDSKDFYPEISKKYSGEDFVVACGYLEYLEYLLTIYRLLELSVRDGKSIVSISKRSNSRLYRLDTVLPDIAVLNFLQPPPGYSEPFEFSIEEEKKFQFPGEFDEALRRFKFKTFFLKMKEGIYKVELLGNISVEEAISYMMFYEVSGYNYILKEVHERVKITSSDMEDVIRELKFRGVTGREALGE